MNAPHIFSNSLRLKLRSNSLRLKLRASQLASPDLIEFEGAIEEQRNRLNSLLRGMNFARCAGHEPGNATLAAINDIAAELVHAAHAYRGARGLG